MVTPNHTRASYAAVIVELASLELERDLALESARFFDPSDPEALDAEIQAHVIGKKIAQLRQRRSLLDQRHRREARLASQRGSATHNTAVGLAAVVVFLATLFACLIALQTPANAETGDDKLIGNGAGETTVTVDTDVTGPAVITVNTSDGYVGRTDTWLGNGEQDEEAVHVVIVHADGTETHVGTTDDLKDGVEVATDSKSFTVDLAEGDQIRLDHASTGGWDSLYVDTQIDAAPAPDLVETAPEPEPDVQIGVTVPEQMSPAPEVNEPRQGVQNDAEIETSSRVQTADPAEPTPTETSMTMTELPHTGPLEVAIVAAVGATLVAFGYWLVRATAKARRDGTEAW